jgi:formate dehydrogenase iron-sulfur subunit
MSKSILVDTTRCIGCGACATACKVVNGLPLDAPAAVPAPSAKSLSETELVDFAQSHGEVGGDLSAKALNVVESHGGVSVRRFCLHCQDPTCVSVCPVRALRKTAAGPVVYDAGRCIGCRYCMMACPFSVPRYEWNVALAPKVKKCTMCAPRQAKGLPPACVAACPAEASTFGERDDLRREAQKRVRENPKSYVHHIYGENEAGGTSVLYLSAVPFGQLGFPLNVPRDPLPAYTFRVLSKLPNVVSVGAALLGGIWWITNLREEVAREEGRESAGREDRGRGREGFEPTR